MENYDVVVIGTGPAGEGAAMMLAKNHRKVAVVERYVEVGGGCTHWGTIPSKALRHAVKTISDMRANPLLRKVSSCLNVTLPQLLSSASGVIDAQVQMRRRFYERNRVPVLEGNARFIDANTLEVAPRVGDAYQLHADKFVIATGSRPYHPPGLDFSHPRVLDSDSVLRYGGSPFSLTIYGAGVIGCEYASIFLHMGIKVTLVNTQDRLLSFMDEEIAEALSYHLRDQGC
ncbi:MAG TPA: FAD-dependent oxidoreductase, partial [Steroidobacteraceae bacterium]|nr:FAD-dependent oxidoreductase [Steroidobacteraceae bacterium]